MPDGITLCLVTPVCNCKLKGKNIPSGFSIGTTLRGHEPTEMSNFETNESCPFEKIAFLWFLLGKFASDIYHFLCLSLCDFSMGKQQKRDFLKRTRFVGFKIAYFSWLMTPKSGSNWKTAWDIISLQLTTADRGVCKLINILLRAQKSCLYPREVLPKRAEVGTIAIW